MDIFLNYNQDFRTRLLASKKHMVCQAAQEDALSILQIMAKSGVDLNGLNDDKQNAFDCAVQNENWAVADWLFENGVDANHPDQNGMTPLMRAIEANKLLRFRYVLETLNKQDVPFQSMCKDPYKILRLAAGCTRPTFNEVMAMLPDNLDLNAACEQDGMTPLHIAVARGRPNVVKALLARGVNFEKARSNGDTPLDVALITGKAEIAKMLLAQGAQVEYKSRVMDAVVREEHVELIQLMAQNRCPMNQRNSDGNAPLHMAVIGEKTKSIQALLECGASLDMLSRTGKSVFQLAESNIEILTLLRQYKREHKPSMPRP